MTFYREKQRFIPPVRNALIKIFSIISILILFNILILIYNKSEFIVVFYSTSILVFSSLLAIYFDFEKDLEEYKKKKKIYSQVSDELLNIVIKVFSFLRLPRKLYLELEEDTRTSVWYKKFYEEFWKILNNFLDDDGLNFLETIREDLCANITEETIYKFRQMYESRKDNPLYIFNKLIKSPYFLKLEPKDQSEILGIEVKLKELIDCVDNAVKKPDETRKRDVKGDTMFPAFYLRYLVLSFFVIYYKANSHKDLSWDEIKEKIHKLSFDHLPM